MAKQKRLSPNQLSDIKADFAGLKSIAAYKPVNNDFEVSAIQVVEDSLEDLIMQEAQAIAHLADLRDQIAVKGTEFIQKMKGAAQQIIAQFGDDSAEIQTLGRKRSSERALGRPSRAKKPA